MRNQNKSMYNEKNANKQSELDKEKISNLYSIDITNKEDFINKINDIVNSNLRGYFEIKKINLLNFENLIKDHLNFIDVNLPILMDMSKLRQNFKDFDHDRHFHGMEANIFYNGLLELNDPLFISQNINNFNEITFVTNVILYNKVTKDNEKVTVAFSFNFEYKSRKEKRLINLIKTTFGLSKINEDIYLKNDRLNNRIIIYEKRRGWLPPVGPSISSNYSICKKDKKVNEEVVTFNDIEDEILIK